jgi:23S rRNA pseudouridine1911/1915/1917 synthase
MEYIVNNDNNERIDQYLSKIEDLKLSRSKIQKLIETNNILVNGNIIKNNYRLSLNDKISINIVEEETDIKPQDIPLDIIYEDDDVMVINKPSGLVVHPGNGNKENTLVNALVNHSNKLSKINGEFRPGIVHRIDKDTSGLLLVAKTDEAHISLSNQLKEKSINRVYIALVKGVINHDTGEIDAPIGRDEKDRKKMTVTSKNSKNAVTHFRVLKRFKNATLIECKLDTGRTHQIRVHMKYINHPVINDPVYYNNKNNKSFGQMLHAKTIGFIHPITNKYMEFSVEPPKEFNDILKEYEEE